MNITVCRFCILDIGFLVFLHVTDVGFKISWEKLLYTVPMLAAWHCSLREGCRWPDDVFLPMYTVRYVTDAVSNEPFRSLSLSFCFFFF
ncbi:hypothetical protein I7I50_04953 [Histoplasma capsulatum G186AR]|uniref:Uncharacterized protein n=1 Tax=Ajellomyces capsulatus TaxID=5037 RepID=A0A8H7Z9N8_AJECA|nr:hypothetical protein I7I52_03211 [Histoplasma capsulatum]QSS75722.1 hypothetical protein I7I50_04953 [Histoplasma capsulatum G186AR]